MNRQFSQRFQEEIDNVNKALIKKGGTKKLEKVWEDRTYKRAISNCKQSL